MLYVSYLNDLGWTPVIFLITIQGEKYFYEFFKPLADVTNLTEEDFDWEMR
jgi:hypothetical protein